MGAAFGAVRVNQKPEPTDKEVTCIFCGLATPVLVSGSTKFASHFLDQVAIVRCKVCGKEAPYRACDTFEFGKPSPARSHGNRS
jgi:transcription elongation factor Elf1